MTNRLAIFGAGGHGKVVADMAECLGWNEIIFYDDTWPARTNIHHWNIVGNYQQLRQQWQHYDGIIIAIGQGKVRLQRIDELIELGANLCTLIHPSAYVSEYVHLDKGSVVMANASINAFTSIGRGGIINTNASVDHDCSIGHGVHICPGSHLAGGVHVGDHSWIGIGSNVIQQVHIGQDVIVGAGSVVLKNISSGTTVIGSPARPLSKN